jgi:hypothetical protein
MHGEIFATIKETLKNPGSMSQEVRDMLILTGIVNLYEEVGELKKMVPLYRVLVFLGTTLVGFVVALLWGIFTGQIRIVLQ